MITVRRLFPTQPSSDATLRKLNIKFSRPPPQYVLFNICIINENNDAHLQSFVSVGDTIDMMIPFVDNDITSMMISPSSDKWDTYDMHITVHDEDGTQSRFSPLYSDVETTCAFVPVKDTRQEIVEQGMEVYRKAKLTTLKYIVTLSVAGCVLLNNTVGEDTAFAFLIGGMTGLGYHILLQYEMDNIGKDAKQKLFIVNTATRLVFLGSVGTAVLTNDPSKFWAIFLGFYTNKLAVLLAFAL